MPLSDWPDVEEMHGRYRMVTPVTTPCLELGALVDQRKRRRRLVRLTGAGLVAIGLALLLWGCS